MHINKLRLAVSQFPVSTDIEENLEYITKHILEAAKSGADVIQFPETALTGYETSIEDIEWERVNSCLERVKILAKNNSIYVVLGFHEKIPDDKRVLNSLCVISNQGTILGSYSKTKLFGSEFNNFITNNEFFIQSIKEVKCGFLICYDSCFPELFDYYRDNGVELLFLSFYNAKNRGGENRLDRLMEAQLITRAADNRFYISGSNSSKNYSRIPSCVASPDGNFVSLKRNEPGVLIYNYPDENLEWTYNNRE